MRAHRGNLLKFPFFVARASDLLAVYFENDALTTLDGDETHS